MEKNRNFLATAIFIIASIFFCNFVEARDFKVINKTNEDLVITVGTITKKVLKKDLNTFSTTSSDVTLVIRLGESNLTLNKIISGNGMVVIDQQDLIQSQTTASASILGVNASSTINLNVSNSLNNITSSETVNINYVGKYKFRVMSKLGYGLRFQDGTEESIYVTDLKKDVVLGIAIDSLSPNILYYAEVRKRLPSNGNKELLILDEDIKIMSYDEKYVKVSLDAEGYKIFFKNQDEPVSLGNKEVSKKIKVPIGQFYFCLGFTDKNGQFEQSVFIGKHVTGNESRLVFTKKDLDNALKPVW